MCRSLRPALLVPLLLLPLGCGHKGPGSFQFAPVSGRVLLENQPLAHAMVRFQPVNRAGEPPDSYGETDDNGNFTLEPVGTAYRGVRGAVVGEHQVQISLLDRDRAWTARGAGELVPARYNAETTLNFNVPPEGSNDAVFQLQKK